MSVSGTSQASFAAPSLHVIPEFYGVYLLQSVPKPRSFYIGSTPDPPRRLRQHNGQLKVGGAFRTKKTGSRPWRMVMVVYNFPSKVAALQFEHSFQHSHETRHIKHADRVCNSRSAGNSLHHKFANVRLLLSSDYFKRWNLKVLVLDETIYIDNWLKNKFRIQLPPQVEVTSTDFDSYFGDTTDLESGDLSSQSNQNLIQIRTENDNTIWEVAKELVVLNSPTCYLCKESIDYLPEEIPPLNSRKDLELFLVGGQLPLVSVCYHDSCHQVFHLSCLSTNCNRDESDSLLPTLVECGNCKLRLEWLRVAKLATKLRHYVLKDSIITRSQAIDQGQ
ncbi:structure-specific endonuclease subunit SLX1 [Scheffersomyces xylosifermentans]|uniref:structure-specific endonuclease subunit SLX1 n=1 Tax=Scheffersomyces xylosifermentans TaxID=1304137 RepID=UPI00315D3357